MDADFKALINALATNDELRQAFLDAPDRATRLQLVRDAGLNAPTEAEVSAFLSSSQSSDEEPSDDVSEEPRENMIVHAMIVWGALD